MAYLQGYLAGIYRSPGVTVSSATTYELLSNGDIEAGDMTGWITTGSATGSTVTATANVGWEEASYGAVLYEGTTGKAEMYQEATLDAQLDATGAANYDVVVSCWAKMTGGVTGNLTVLQYTTGGTLLTSGSVTLVSDHAYYPARGWGYFSVCLDCADTAATFRFRIRRDVGSSGSLYIDNCSMAIVEQICGAYGTLTMDGYEWEEKDITTFCSMSTDGPFGRWQPTMRAPMSLPLTTYYNTTDDLSDEMAQEEKVFVKVITQQKTKTSDRWEFWAYPTGFNWSAPKNEVQMADATLRVDRLVGMADR